MQIVVPFG
jgi:hypothetical protein